MSDVVGGDAPGLEVVTVKTVAADEPYIAILSALDIPDAVLNTCGGSNQR